jgi:hypothetical protein
MRRARRTIASRDSGFAFTFGAGADFRSDADADSDFGFGAVLGSGTDITSVPR